MKSSLTFWQLAALFVTVAYCSGSYAKDFGVYTGPDVAAAFKSRGVTLTRKASESIVRSALLLNQEHGCTGIFVSHSGYLLTALHCLLPVTGSPNSPQSNPFFSMEVLSPNLQSSPLIVKPKMQKLIGQKIPLKTLRLTANGLNEHRDTATVVAVGRGFPFTFPKENELDLATRMRDRLDDFALLKLDSLPDGFSCASLRGSHIPDRLPVVSVGYPHGVGAEFWRHRLRSLTNEQYLAEAKAINDRLAQGDRSAFNVAAPLYFALGEAFSSYNSMFEKVGPLAPSVGYADSISDPKILVHSSTAFRPGMSGGGLFDFDGKLVGIHSMHPLFSANASANEIGMPFEYGLSSVRTDHIRSEIEQTLGSVAAAKIFACER